MEEIIINDIIGNSIPNYLFVKIKTINALSLVPKQI
ncbi:hypothetical protein SAMN06296427_109147 [Moheibacter sediminis]|uniref:Uncharacterized protein n=1 Tax=Moheibacter sediminis TaxID=1434700 RepID=A0A1W2CCG5_9FLAO|nr:hypothetical protein SAMN06296427_109147 [Moheibacter sediminis]